MTPEVSTVPLFCGLGVLWIGAVALIWALVRGGTQKETPKQ